MKIVTDSGKHIEVSESTAKLLKELQDGMFWTEWGGVQCMCRGIAKLIELELEKR